MNIAADFPGTPQHQALLWAITSYYEDDPRVLSVVVFGSLGRGDWDSHSDLDMDVVVADGVQIVVAEELERLCASLASVGERAALIIPYDDEEGDVVFESLMQLSIRYHPLSTTSPNITSSLRVIAGRIDQATIKAAGQANWRQGEAPLGQLLDRCVRYAVGVHVSLHRQQIWKALEELHRMRGLLMELFARTHGGGRAFLTFQTEADPQLQARLGATLPQFSLASVQKALVGFLSILEDHLPEWADGQLQLSDAQRELLQRLRARQDDLNP